MAVAATVLWLGSGATAGAEAPAAAPAFVIGPGLEKLFLSLTDPRPERFPGGFVLDEAAIERSQVALTYAGPRGAKVRLLLVHDGGGGAELSRTDKFALLAGGGAPPPPALVKALAARLRAGEGAFHWTALAETAHSPDSAGFPIIPDDAVPASRLRRLAYPTLDPPSLELLHSAEALARAGKDKEARAAAAALGSTGAGAVWPTAAAAMVLRSVGDGAAAAALLSPLVARTDGLERADADRLRLELAAAEELAGRPREAAAALAARGQPGAGGPPCARAEALTVLVQEGRARDVRRLTEADAAGAPRCLLLVRLRAAIEAGDDGAIDAAGEAAARANPRDQDLFYLWGTSFYDRQEFQRALAGWDRLAAVNPTYPGFLGLYGSTYHVLGRLTGATLDGYLARARKSPDDLIANHLGGIGLYYQRKYAEAIPLLEAVTRRSDEPRAGMYLAMSHFFTGDPEGAMKMLDALEPMAHREPDIYYCRSLVYRFYDMPRAIREMQTFLDVFLEEHRPAFGQQKIDKARSDLERLKKGEVPSVYLEGQGSYTPPPLRKK